MNDSQAQAARTTAVVVNYNAGAYLRQCIDALARSDQTIAVQIVDNASRDGSLTDLPEAVDVTVNDQNLGFSKACNQGAAGSSGEFLLFLNPDCFVEPDTVSTLTSILDRNPEYALVGARIVDPDGADQRASRRRLPTVARTFFTFSGLERLEHQFPGFQGINMATTDIAEDVEPVGAVSGALMLIRRADFEQIGGFDEAYFLHCEDLDLCQRLALADRLVGFVPAARATHVKGVTQRRLPWRSEWLKHRNMLRFVRKFRLAGAWGSGLLAVAVWLRFVLLSPVLAWRQVRSSAHD